MDSRGSGRHVAKAKAGARCLSLWVKIGGSCVNVSNLALVPRAYVALQYQFFSAECIKGLCVMYTR